VGGKVEQGSKRKRGEKGGTGGKGAKKTKLGGDVETPLYDPKEVEVIHTIWTDSEHVSKLQNRKREPYVEPGMIVLCKLNGTRRNRDDKQACKWLVVKLVIFRERPRRRYRAVILQLISDDPLTPRTLPYFSLV
jgi:hypothetical protein